MLRKNIYRPTQIFSWPAEYHKQVCKFPYVARVNGNHHKLKEKNPNQAQQLKLDNGWGI